MSSNVRVVNLIGDVTVATAGSFVEPLLAARDASMILVSLSQVTDIDLAGIQLLYAAARSARASGTPLHFTGAVPALVLQRLRHGGFLGPGDVDARVLAERLVAFSGEESADD